jgi:hypothetical protein
MILLQGYGRRLPSVLLSAIRQDFYAKPVAWSQPLFRSARPRAASVSINEDTAPQNVDHMAINQALNDRFFNRDFRIQASTPPAIEHLSSPSADGSVAWSWTLPSGGLVLAGQPGKMLK